MASKAVAKHEETTETVVFQGIDPTLPAVLPAGFTRKDIYNSIMDAESLNDADIETFDLLGIVCGPSQTPDGEAATGVYLITPDKVYFSISTGIYRSAQMICALGELDGVNPVPVVVKEQSLGKGKTFKKLILI